MIKEKNDIMQIKEKILIFFLLFISFFVNYYYGSIGVFPIDTFAHFDSGYRIINGSVPFKDYWTLSGPMVDYIQSLFFLTFGISWFSYLMHPSLLNVILALSVFYFLKKYKLNKYFCFFYSLCFAILAYPSVGVPFADHHSSFFSLLGIILLSIAVKENKFFYWFFIPILFFIAFFSKQTPSAYIIFLFCIFIIYYSMVKKDFFWFYPVLASSFFCFFILFIFLFFNNIDFKLFLTQYFFFPQSIGAERVENFNFTLNGLFFHFKFIYLACVPIIYFTFSGLFNSRLFYKSNQFFDNIILLFFTLTLIFHQLITKNQTFIFFLIPLILGFSHASFKMKKNKNFFIFFLVIVCVFTTAKYHLRFNEDRKFMELSNVNLNLSKEADYIDKKLKGLKWITPIYPENAQEELSLIKNTISYLKMEKKNMMVITHYQFFSSIIKKDLMSPNRWFTSDGVSYPLEKHKYFSKYQTFFKNLVSIKKIDVIYTVKPIKIDAINIIFKENCLKTTEINKILQKHELDECY